MNLNKEEFEEFFNQNEPMIWDILNRYYKNVPDMWEDLYQTGALTLTRCIQLYNEERTKFSSYSYRSIKCSMARDVIMQRNVFRRNNRDYKIVSIILSNGDKDVNEIYREYSEINSRLSEEQFYRLYNSVFKWGSLNNELDDIEFVDFLKSDSNTEQEVEDKDSLNRLVDFVINSCLGKRTSDKNKKMWEEWYL